MKLRDRRHGPVWSPLLAAIAIAAGACAGPNVVPTGTTSGPSGSAAVVDVGDAPPNVITASQDGVTVTVALDGSVVGPGQSVLMTATVRNDRPIPTIVGFSDCGAPATISGDVAVPWDPVGKHWDGLAGEFKRFATEQGRAGGGVPADQPVTIYARGDPCEVGDQEIRLGPGASTTALVTWTAQIVEDVPALPGDVPITVGVVYDRPDPLPAPVCNPICGLRTIPWKSLAANGVIRVAGAAPRIVTAGEAVDALLADERFAAWLPSLPSATWSGSNLFLQNMRTGGGIVPPGPTWEVDLFRENGVPRTWAIGFVDAFSGSVRNVAFCDDPCDR
jgi:hypothetical protein